MNVCIQPLASATISPLMFHRTHRRGHSSPHLCCPTISHASEYSSLHRCQVLDCVAADISSPTHLASCAAHSPAWLQQVAIPPPIQQIIYQFPDTHTRNYQTSPNSRLRPFRLRQIHFDQTSSQRISRSLRTFCLTHHARPSSWRRTWQGLLVCLQRRLPEES